MRQKIMKIIQLLYVMPNIKSMSENSATEIQNFLICNEELNSNVREEATDS